VIKRQWLLSGNPNLLAGSVKSEATGNEQKPWEAATLSNQIASVEYRIARGQLLERQPWTARNATIRALQAVGSIATGFTFALDEKGIIQGIGVFTGQVIPSAQAFWPDSTVTQMNRISDVGFQVNKLIPENGSDIIVAFFPIDRFLTPGLKKIFLKSPALYFTPAAALFDEVARQQLEPVLTTFLGSAEAKTTFDKARKAVIDSVNSVSQRSHKILGKR